MKHSAFSVKPNFVESSEELKFYQTRPFKIAAALGIFILLVLFGIGPSFNASEDTKLPPQEVSLSHSVGAKNTPTVNDPVSSASQNHSLSKHQSQNAPKSIRVGSVESACRISHSIWQRHRKIIIVMSVAVFILTAAAIGLLVYYEKERQKEEVAAAIEEERRLKELEEQQQPVDDALPSMFIPWWTVILNMYKVSFVVAILTVINGYHVGWSQYFPDDPRSRAFLVFFGFMALQFTFLLAFFILVFLLHFIFEFVDTLPYWASLLFKPVKIMLYMLLTLSTIPFLPMAVLSKLLGGRYIGNFYWGIWRGLLSP